MSETTSSHPHSDAGESGPRLGRRDFARMSLALATGIVGSCAARPTAGTPPAVTSAGVRPTSLESFDGDYSTGDFSQWWVQCKGYNGEGSAFPGSYSAGVVPDAQTGHAARFEVRTGDVAPFGGGERSEVSGGDSSGGVEGQVRWYRLATKFDPSFPDDHASLGWGLTNQWHGGSNFSTPPLNWSVSHQDGQWTLLADRQSSAGDSIGQIALFNTPLAPGTWHDVQMQIGWSASDSVGFVELWHNGVRQQFTDGSQTYRVRTLVPGGPAPSVYYKEGYYRQNGIAPTGVVYHAGFRCAPTQAAL
ncbi:MAG: polysaccharide lyase [Mycobacterium sp.]